MVEGTCYIYTAACIVFGYVLILNLAFRFASSTLEIWDSAISKALGFFVLPAFRRKSRTYVGAGVC